MNRLCKKQRKAVWAVIQPGIHEFEALETLFGNCTTLELPFKDEYHVNRQFDLIQRRAY